MGIDPEMLVVRRRALELIQEGMTPSLVARYLGCARSSIYNWLKAARETPVIASGLSGDDRDPSSNATGNPQSGIVSSQGESRGVRKILAAGGRLRTPHAFRGAGRCCETGKAIRRPPVSRTSSTPRGPGAGVPAPDGERD